MQYSPSQKTRQIHTSFSFLPLLLFSLYTFPNSVFAQPQADLHQPFDEILQQYVVGERFDYEGLIKQEKDLRKLNDYIRRLESIRPGSLERDDELAYWINLYNAAILRLVLQHYPVESIRDIKWLWVLPPWVRNVVTVSGEKLSLYEIEHNIIRRRFTDARIHFAINCASVGCPPLSNRAFIGRKINAQLDEATRRVINDSRWVDITGEEIRLTQIFEWYEADFKKAAGSIREFVARYRPEEKEILLDAGIPVVFPDYDWNLNKIEPAPHR